MVWSASYPLTHGTVKKQVGTFCKDTFNRRRDGWFLQLFMELPEDLKISKNLRHVGML